MSEAQAFIALPSFLTQFAKSQYDAGSELLTAGEGSIASWPEAVQYLLRIYAHATHIAVAIMDLTTIRQASSESGNSFSKRINDAVARCGNDQSTQDVATIFIDGLDGRSAPESPVIARRTATRRT